MRKPEIALIYSYLYNCKMRKEPSKSNVVSAYIFQNMFGYKINRRPPIILVL